MSAAPKFTHDDFLFRDDTVICNQAAVIGELIAALRLIETGLTSNRNACWPTVKRWTKKERDAAMLNAARAALAKATP
jgi:hypothetical protein